MRELRRAADPAHWREMLLWGEPCLVGHFSGSGDPIAKVNEGKTAGLGEGDLIHDDVVPKAPLRQVRLVEAIDEGNPVAETIAKHGSHEGIVVGPNLAGPVDPILRHLARDGVLPHSTADPRSHHAAA